jgi:hypothetical protein
MELETAREIIQTAVVVTALLWTAYTWKQQDKRDKEQERFKTDEQKRLKEFEAELADKHEKSLAAFRTQQERELEIFKTNIRTAEREHEQAVSLFYNKRFDVVNSLSAQIYLLLGELVHLRRLVNSEKLEDVQLLGKQVAKLQGCRQEFRKLYWPNRSFIDAETAGKIDKCLKLVDRMMPAMCEWANEMLAGGIAVPYHMDQVYMEYRDTVNDSSLMDLLISRQEIEDAFRIILGPGARVRDDNVQDISGSKL